MNIKRILLSGLSVMAMVSCSDVVDYKDNIDDKFVSNGAPVINAIYDVQDTAQVPTALEGGVLNQMLRISGQNLSHVKKVTFNGVEVDLRQVYAEANNSYVKIPRVIPEQITDELVYETEQGTVTRHFPISIPRMKVVGLANEFVKPGSKVQVKGEYFDLFGFGDTTDVATVSIVISNIEINYQKEIKTDSLTEEYFGIQIPKDCPDNSLITLKWLHMGEQCSATIPYRMTNALMFGNFDGDLGWWNDWGKGLVTDGTKSGDPESLGYKFLRLVGEWDAWSWNSTGLGCNWTWLDASLHPENYVLKFELCTNSACPIPNYGDNGANGAKNGGYCFTLNNAKIRGQWDPSVEGLSNTYGHWQTVSIPLTNCIQDGNLPTEETWVSLELVCQPNTADAWKVDHCFGQFRIEPKEYK